MTTIRVRISKKVIMEFANSPIVKEHLNFVELEGEIVEERNECCSKCKDYGPCYKIGCTCHSKGTEEKCCGSFTGKFYSSIFSCCKGECPCHIKITYSCGFNCNEQIYSNKCPAHNPRYVAPKNEEKDCPHESGWFLNKKDGKEYCEICPFNRIALNCECGLSLTHPTDDCIYAIARSKKKVGRLPRHDGVTFHDGLVKDLNHATTEEMHNKINEIIDFLGGE